MPFKYSEIFVLDSVTLLLTSVTLLSMLSLSSVVFSLILFVISFDDLAISSLVSLPDFGEKSKPPNNPLRLPATVPIATFLAVLIFVCFSISFFLFFKPT